MSLFDTNNRTASVTFYRNDMGLITVEVPATNYDSAKRTVIEQYGNVKVLEKISFFKDLNKKKIISLSKKTSFNVFKL